MLIVFSIINIIIAAYGIYRSYKKSNLIIFVWFILLYYAITSSLSCLSVSSYSIITSSTISNQYIPIKIKVLCLFNMVICYLSFLISDLILNRKKINIREEKIPDNYCKIIESIFGLSLFFSFLKMMQGSYEDFVNSNDGGGWSLVFLQASSCIIFILTIKKQYLKLIFIGCVFLLIIGVNHVRSLLFYPLLPIFTYLLYKGLNFSENFKRFLYRLIPIGLSFLGIAFILSIIRTGQISLPETNLTDIALEVLNSKPKNLHYFNSIENYLFGFISPFINILSKMGFIMNIDPPLSIPKQNVLVSYGMDDFDTLDGAYHFPATIFLDLYLSWGALIFVAAFLFYGYLVFLFSLWQKNFLSLCLFSSVFLWHIYMLLRGSVDYSSMGISYALYIVLIFYYIISKFLKKRKYREFIAIQ